MNEMRKLIEVVKEISEAVPVAPSAGKKQGSAYVVYSKSNDVFFDGNAWVHSGLNARKVSKDATAKKMLAKAQQGRHGQDAEIYIISYDITKADI